MPPISQTLPAQLLEEAGNEDALGCSFLPADCNLPLLSTLVAIVLELGAGARQGQAARGKLSLQLPSRGGVFSHGALPVHLRRQFALCPYSCTQPSRRVSGEASPSRGQSSLQRLGPPRGWVEVGWEDRWQAVRGNTIATWSRVGPNSSQMRQQRGGAPTPGRRFLGEFDSCVLPRQPTVPELRSLRGQSCPGLRVALGGAG